MNLLHCVRLCSVRREQISKKRNLVVILGICVLLPLAYTFSWRQLNIQQHQTQIHEDNLYTFIQLNRDMVCEKQDNPRFTEEPQKWQNVSEMPVKVFSAFFDGRPEADGPIIRVIGAGLQAAYNNIGDIYCTLWYERIGVGLSTGPAIYERIYPSTLHPDMWVSHFIKCPLLPNSTDLPYAVSITKKACATPVNHLMVLNRNKVKKSDTHALCISPLWRKYRDWRMLINVVEIHRLLGVSAIATYNLSVSKTTGKLLKSYLDEQDISVSVIQWPLLPARISYWLQRGALNDCLYRMGHYHKYVTISDLDEIVVPRMAETWPALLKEIDRPARGIFMFQHVYFRRNTSGEEPYLVTQQSLWRTKDVYPLGKIRCKSMYKADRAIKVDIHFAYKLTKGTEEYMVDPKEGMLHHYREQPMQFLTKNPEGYTFVEDLYMTRFKDRLLTAFTKRAGLVNSNN